MEPVSQLELRQKTKKNPKHGTDSKGEDGGRKN